MKITSTLVLLACGLFLFALERLVPKQYAIQLDNRLSQYVFLNWKKLILLFFIIPLPFMFYQLIRTIQSFSQVIILLVISIAVLILGFVSWMILGGLLAGRVSRNDSDDPLRPWFIFFFALSTPLILLTLLLLTFVRLLLYPLIHPMKGILLFKKRWFNSILGPLGLGLFIIGVISGRRMIVGVQVSKNLITILDWIGSVLMLGSIWGWIYSRISNPIKRRLARSERRLSAMGRMLSIKYGEGVLDGDDVNVKDPWLKRYRAYRAKLGVNKDMPLLERAYVLASTNANIEANRSANPNSHQEYEEVEQYKKDRNQMILLAIRLGLTTALQWSRRSLIRMVDKITYSVFSGMAGALLFLLGFVMWNLSKILSLYGP